MTRASTCRPSLPVVAERAAAAVLIGESGPTLEALFRDAGLADTQRADDARGRGPAADAIARNLLAAGGRRAAPATVLLSPAAASFDMFVDYAARGRAFKESVERLAAERRAQPGREPMSATLPVPRTSTPDAPPRRTPAKPRKETLKRERHQADYTILVVVVALIAIGILMVYSSSAMKAYLRDDDTLSIVGPQIGWAVLGLVAMAIMMRVDYRYLRLVSVPVYLVALVLLALVFVPSLNVVVGGSARWLKVGPLPAVHPAEFAKLAMVIYLAHWFAKRGTGIKGWWTGTVPFLVIIAPIIVLVFREPDLGTTMVLGLTALAMFYLAGANMLHFAWIVGIALVAMVVAGLRGYQLERIRTWLNPWADPLGTGFHTIQGLLALGAGRHPRAPGWARAGWPAASSCRTRATTTSSRSSARSSG